MNITIKIKTLHIIKKESPYLKINYEKGRGSRQRMQVGNSPTEFDLPLSSLGG